MPRVKYDSISKILTNIIPYYLEAGIEVHVITSKREYGDYEFKDGVHYHRFGGKEGFEFFAAEIADKQDLDLLEMYNRAWLFPAKKALNLIHMSNAHFNKKHNEWLQPVSKITVISQYCYDMSIISVPDLHPRMVISHLGVDLDLYQPMDKKDHPTLAYIGIIDKNKGTMSFIRTANILLEEIPDLEVIVVGPTWRPNYEKECMDAADERINFVGEVEADELPLYYATADVYCVPMAFVYTWSLANIESQAAGTPVITTNKGGLPDTIIPNETGYIVDSFDLLVERTKYLLTNRDVAKAMGLKGRKFVEQFSWEGTASRQMAIYEEALS